MDYYTDDQFKEILAAKRKGINLTRLMNPELTASQMREIRLGEIAGVDTTLYASKDISAEKMRMTRKFLIKGLPISEEQLHQYNEAQLNEIRLGEKFGLNTKEYGSPWISAKQMKSMRLLLLTNKVIEFLKEKSIHVIHRIEDSLSNVQVQPQAQAPSQPSSTRMDVPVNTTSKDLKAEKVQNVIINVLETMDLSKFQNIESLSEAIGEMLKDDKILETLSSETQTSEAPHGTFEILKTVAIDDESFAVIRNVETNQFYTVNHYKDVDEASATWNIENEFTCYEDANKSLSNKILETKEVSDVNIVVEENPAGHGEAQAAISSEELEKDTSVESDEKQVIAINEDTSVHELLKLSTSKDEEVRNKVALHENTSPSVLSRLSADASEKVALSAIQNKNIPTGTLKGIIASLKTSEVLKEHAKITLDNRDDNINIEVIIDKTCILEEIKLKSKDLGMLTIVKMPSNEQVGEQATIIVPSFAIKDTKEGKKLSLSENRKYELRINAKESVMIDGKSLSGYFDDGKQKSLSLNERIENAKEKKSTIVKKESKELDKSKER